MSTQWRVPPLPPIDPDGLALPPVYAESYGGTLLARPVFLAEDRARRLGDDLHALFRLLVDLPDRVANGDLSAYAELIRVPAALRPVLTVGNVRRLPTYARADLIDDGQELRLVELNVGSELGGVDAAQMNQAWLGDDGFAAAADAWQLRHVDTAAHTAALLRDAGHRVGRSHPRCALVEARGALADHHHVFVALREALAAHGIDLELAEIDELRSRPDGRIDLAGRPVDVVLRYFAAHEIAEDGEAVEIYRALERADAHNRTALVCSLAAQCLASKASLAVLHQGRTRGLLSATERDLVDRLVPWSGLAADPAARARALADRDGHVLKPGIGYSGVGTVIGSTSTRAQWERALAAAAESDGVVQQRVRPAAEMVTDLTSGQPEEWHANWGVFVTDEGYAGGFVRALRPEHGAVIGYANPGTRGAPIFTSPFPDPSLLATGAPS